MISTTSTAGATSSKDGLQERYGLARDRVRRDVDDWLKMQP
jgi:uncharacterized protein YjbJ (UPF0337 family)